MIHVLDLKNFSAILKILLICITWWFEVSENEISFTSHLTISAIENEMCHIVFGSTLSFSIIASKTQFLTNFAAASQQIHLSLVRNCSVAPCTKLCNLI